MPVRTEHPLQLDSEVHFGVNSNSTSRGEYIQYGCGLSAPEGWQNFDSSRTLIFERLPLIGRLYTKNASRFPPNVRYGDIIRGLPVADGTASGVYASHVLEHLSYDDAMRALKNTYRMLRPGGIFRLIVPDLELITNQYINAARDGSPEASVQFMDDTSLGRRTRPRGLTWILYGALNSSDHLWMWDYAGMAHALASHGFRCIRRCHFADHDDPMFQRVESQDRFENNLAIEARR